VVVEFDIAAKVAVADIEAVEPVAVVAVQQRDPLKLDAAAEEGKHWMLSIVRQKGADWGVEPKATWRLVRQELILAVDVAAVAVLAVVAVAGETFQALEAFEQQNTVKPLQPPAAAIPDASVVSATTVVVVVVGAVVDIEAAVVSSPSLRELPRWNKSQIRRMD
jgi:hypothetical protein